MKYSVCGVYSPAPRAEVYCLHLNFKISKLAYYHLLFVQVTIKTFDKTLLNNIVRFKKVKNDKKL